VHRSRADELILCSAHSTRTCVQLDIEILAVKTRQQKSSMCNEPSHVWVLIKKQTALSGTEKNQRSPIKFFMNSKKDSKNAAVAMGRATFRPHLDFLDKQAALYKM